MQLPRLFGETLKLKVPVIIVNFKTYSEATGARAVKLSKLIEKIADNEQINAAVAPQNIDLAKVAEAVNIPILAQHVDPIKPGSFTGSILPEAIKACGAAGSLINHSEKPMNLNQIKVAIERLRELKLISVACAKDVENSIQIAKLRPDFIAIEPPALIGGGIAVSKAEPELVSGAVAKIHKINPKVKVLCGAGITTAEDVKAALRLGTVGVLLASGVVKAKDPARAMRDLCSGLKF